MPLCLYTEVHIQIQRQMLAHIQYTQRHAHAHTHTCWLVFNISACFSVYPYTYLPCPPRDTQHVSCQQLVKYVSSTYPFLPLCVSVFGYPYTYLPSPPRDTQHVSAASKACQQHLSVPASLCICIRISVYIPPLPSSGRVARGEPRDIRVCVVLCGSCCPSAPSASTVKHVSS